MRGFFILKQMKKLLFGFGLFGLIATAHAADMTVYWGDGCPHCAYQKQWMETDLTVQYRDLDIDMVEVWHNKENMATFTDAMAAEGLTVTGVPTTFVNGKVIVGAQIDAIQSAVDDMMAPAIEFIPAPKTQPAVRTVVPNRPVQTRTRTMREGLRDFRETLGKPLPRFKGTRDNRVRMRMHRQPTKLQTIRSLGN